MKRLLLLLPLIALLPLSSAEGTATYVLQINMYGDNVVPAVETHSYGFVRFFFNEDRTEADVTVDIKGYSNNAVTGATINAGAPGENGPVVFTLSNGNFIVTSTHLTMTPDQVKTFVSGAWYVTLTTSFHPEGEMRGQIYVPSDFLSPSATGGGYPAPSEAPPTQPPPAVAPTPAPSAGGGSASGSGGGGTGSIQPPNTGDGGLR
jgi:CHRD domain